MKGAVVLKILIVDGVDTTRENIEEKKVEVGTIGLTEQELDILKLLGEGMSNRDISKKLFLSEGSVKNYITGLLKKFGLRDRTQLAICYIKNW